MGVFSETPTITFSATEAAFVNNARYLVPNMSGSTCR